MSLRAAAIALGILALPGCYASHTRDGALGVDGGRIDGGRGDGGRRDGGGPIPCGETTCGPGEVCCSAMCSVCGPADLDCPDIDCLPSCDFQDARGVGGCEIVRGWAWTGATCVAVEGCDCVGADCGDLSSTPDLCVARFSHCDSARCGGRAGIVCPPDQWCDFEPDDCGGDDSLGFCRPRPRDCPDPGGVPVCGCDGVDYWADCPANMAGVDRRHFGPCETPAGTFGRALRSCGPDDGPAWTFLFTSAPEPCDERFDARIEIHLFQELDGAMLPTGFRVGSGPAFGGSAVYCPGPSLPCIRLEGSVVVDSFALGEVARLDYELLEPSGARHAGTGVEVTSWCSIAPPSCP